MTYYELIKLNAPLLLVMKRNGVLLDDVEAVAIYEEYNEMLAQGNKKLYINAELSRRHGVSPRSIYDIRRRFDTPIDI